MGYVV